MDILMPLRRIKKSAKNHLRRVRRIGDGIRLRYNLFDINLFKTINIETCSLCHLECPYCPTGMRLELKDTPKGMLKLDALKAICSLSLTNYRGRIGLYNWGEPFLNPELPDIVRHLKENTKATLVINSNFSYSEDDRVRDVLSCLKHDIIIISCDGYSQETCEKYRKNVDFAKVMHNVELMLDHKHPNTMLIWQYLKFPWSMDEIDAAQKYCQAKGITFYTGGGGITPNYPMLPTPRSSDAKRYRCDFFLDSLVVNYDGEVYPCCAFYGPRRYSLGNAKDHSIVDIFKRLKGREMLKYLSGKTSSNNDLFCRLCVEKNTDELKTWKV